MVTADLPRWDLDVIFNGFSDPRYAQAKTELEERIRSLLALEGELGLADPVRLEPEVAAAALDRVLPAYNAVLKRMRAIGSYLYGRVTTDSRDEEALGEDSEQRLRTLPLSRFATRFTAWVGAQDIDAILPLSGEAEAHAFLLQRTAEAARYQMTPLEEALATELSLTGSSAWGKLHGNFTSRLKVTVPLPSGPETLPMSAVRNLASEPDRSVRQAAYEAELAGWKEAELVTAACMNGIKGEANTVGKKRGWEDAVAPSLHGANIDRETLNAMNAAVEASFPDFRRYLQAKAKMLGLSKLAFYDLFAPLGGEGRDWSYPEAERFVARHFRAYSDKLGDFAERSFRERWTDAGPREGKRDGAYCMGIGGDASRILMNFRPAFNSVSTLAHELGHAYHNLCLAERTSLQQSTPMTLAETASIFCETIVKRAAMEEGSDGDRLAILEGSLQGACQVVVDIASRFRFERAVHEEREARELSPSRLCELMLQAQRETYGDGLDAAALHPYMWAVKPHYYGGRSFYNFPYTFGLLFGLGLYAVYQSEPNGFHARYDRLLSETGMRSPADLAAEFGIDIRAEAFWRAGLDQIRADIDRFVALA